MNKEVIGLIMGFILFLLGSISMGKLYGYLEKNRPEIFRTLNPPKKIFGILYYRSFKTVINGIQFIFSEEDFNDVQIETLRDRAKVGFLIFLLGFAIWMLSMTSIISKMRG